jgi:pSer/pThr/pTyr-binding forkhead associated (FHA) protein
MTIREPAQVRRVPTVDERREQNAEQTPTFAPLHRPPVALLTILDDGSDGTGEVVRLRSNRTTIGRSEGDVRIIHDEGVSAQHAELSRRAEDGVFRWYLKDLQSTNGTFVRVTNSALRHNQQLLLGRSVYRFEILPPAAARSYELNDDPPLETRVLVGGDAELAMAPPSLVRLAGQEAVQTFALKTGETTVGRDPLHSSLVLDEPLVSPLHARLWQGDNGVWNLEDLGSHNGTWVRIQEVVLGAGAEFLLGEQRFQIRLP